ncbi:uracil-DNA glycosylase family protein [Hyphobacterium marinum]|uniref:Uracil-DNA glycosylase family protein n=1 Tax=Hyphobacterium marinum TaxID=3116574 RepID=A0ABU7M0E9_9PROT|nr:uracil-DNA glycosylase family protein [Hyphobacterium sp. Y6023]MEE2567292.1 uracil-DNA glycosylase family protein [Hyphobacterium sp. Y6023]
MTGKPPAQDLDTLLGSIRACRLCAGEIPEPRPVVQAAPGAKVRIVGQAPGTRVHASGKPFTDPSGDRLRDWLGIDETVFYDPQQIAITPMGFCFPGLDEKGGDKPPPARCAKHWQADLSSQLQHVELTLLVGLYAQRHFLGNRAKPTLTQTVRAWRDYAPSIIPLPHPSWRNNSWLKKNPWFAEEVLPMLRRGMSKLVRQA